MEKINILFVILQMNVMGGSERLVYNIIKKIDRYIFNPSVAWFNGDKPLEEYVELNIPLYHIPKKKSLDLLTMRLIKKLIKENNIKVINAHHFMSMAYAYYGCKMGTQNGLIYTEHSEWEIDKISWKWLKIGAYMAKKLDSVVGVGENITTKMVEKFKVPVNKSITIQNGVDLDQFKLQSPSILSRAQLGLHDSDKVIGMVANFRKVKNHLFLLKSFKALLDSGTQAKLILIGKDPQGEPDNTFPDVVNYIEQNDLGDFIHLLGYRKDVSELLKLMDVFCLASLKEGHPISLVEAMAARLPTIGTNVEGIRDVILNGKNGFLVGQDDVQGMKDALHTLLIDEGMRKRMGEESSKMARENFALNHCVEKYQQLFLAAANQP